MKEFQPASKPLSAVERLLEMIEKSAPCGTPNCEWCVEFIEAKRRIAALSSGANQWVVSPASTPGLPNSRWAFLYLIIGFSNPDHTGVPNHICYCVPLFLAGTGVLGNRSLLACFSPHAIVPLSGALHWEDGVRDTDDLRDWELFWAPMNQCFWPLETPSEPESEAPTGTDLLDIPPMTNTSVSWKKSVDDLVHSWQTSPDALVKKILL